MISKRHTIRNDDESIWVDFDGDVPRIGDSIDLSLVAKFTVLPKEQLTSKKWVVYKVDWFLSSWWVEPTPSLLTGSVIISRARVFIKEAKE